MLNVFIAGMNDNDHDGLKPFLSLIYYILYSVGDKTDMRFEKTLKVLIDVAESNQQFYKWMEVVYEFIFKLSAAIPRVSEWFKFNAVGLNWLLDWANQVIYPQGSALDQNGCRLYKKRQQYQQYP